MTTVEPNEGGTFRFSLVSLRPIPDALIAHVRRVLRDEARDLDERSQRAEGLSSFSWLFTSESDVDSLHLNLRGPAMALGVDSALLTGELATNGPRMIVTDVDSTFIEQEVIELLAAHAGVEDEVRAVTESAMRGEIDFGDSLAQRVATLKGVPASAIIEVADELTLSPGAKRFVEIARRNEASFGLVSGGFQPIVEPLAKQHNIDHWIANGLEIDGEILTGRTTGRVIDADAKRETLIEWAHEAAVDLSLVVAVGDGANDLHMLETAGLGVGYMPKEIVREQADAVVSFPRLDAVAILAGWEL